MTKLHPNDHLKRGQVLRYFGEYYFVIRHTKEVDGLLLQPYGANYTVKFVYSGNMKLLNESESLEIKAKLV
jgi:hypothetical protein